MDQKNRRLFATCDNMTMAVVDADSGKVIATPRIGYGPYVSFFDPDTELVFSSNGAGTLTVIHEDSPNQFTVLDNVPTDWLAPRAKPIAAAIPIAGAPRTTIF